MRTWIKDFPNHVGEEVELRGWMYNLRSSGKIHFMQLRDGTGFIQGVVLKSDIGEDKFKAIKKLKIESSVIVKGMVRKEKRAPTGYEIDVKDVEIVQNPSEDYPISKKEHGIDFLFDHRHLWLRSKRQYAILKIRDEIIWAIREYFHKNGYTLVDSPILTGAIGESAGNLFELNYFDWTKAYLSQTGQLYLEAAIASLSKVYCFGPTFRAEKSKTRRHLSEFWMVEAELAYCDNECNMKVQEELVSYIVEKVLSNRMEELKILDRDIDKLKNIKPPFDKISYDDAVKFLQAKGHDIKWGDDLGADDETELSNAHDTPLFVMNYPKEAKAFYMEPNPEDPKTVLCDDMLAPEGYGEIIGASQRIHDPELLVQKLKDNDLPVEAYDWYLDLRKWGSTPHSGFGLGIERTVAWVCGLKHVREAIPFPRTLNRLKP